jgi:hypothetical protein
MGNRSSWQAVLEALVKLEEPVIHFPSEYAYFRHSTILRLNEEWTLLWPISSSRFESAAFPLQDESFSICKIGDEDTPKNIMDNKSFQLDKGDDKSFEVEKCQVIVERCRLDFTENSSSILPRIPKMPGSTFLPQMCKLC